MNRLNMSRVTLLTLTTALASANAVNGLTHVDDTPTADPTDARLQVIETRTDGDLVIVEARGHRISTLPFETMRNSEAAERAENRGAIAGDEENRPMLGIGMADGDRGVLITDVYPGTPAHQAGLRPGDEILGPDDETRGPDDDRFDTERLAEMMNELRPGQRVEMRFLRDGEEMNTQVRLASWNPHLMEREESDHPADDRERPEMNRIVEMLREAIPGMFENEDLNLDIEVFEEDGAVDISIMQSPETFVRAVDELEGLSEVIIMMVEEMLAEEEGRDEGHEEEHDGAWREDGRDHEWNEDEGHGEDLQHHVERMLEEAWMDMKGWGSDMEEGLHQFIRDCDHRFDEFAEMADRRMGEVENDLNRRIDEMHGRRDQTGERLDEMLQDRDRRIEDALRNRDQQIEKGARQFQRRIEEAGREIEDTIRRVIESQARLAEQNRRLEARIERLERAIRNNPETKDNPRPNARNRDGDRKAGDQDQKRRRRRSRQESRDEDDA